MAEPVVSPADPAPPVETVGANSVRLWGLTMPERVARIARAAGLPLAGSGPDIHTEARPRILTNAAFAFDPPWLHHVVAQPGYILTVGGVPVLAHARDGDEATAIRTAMAESHVTALPAVAYEDGPTIENKALRKRETPFVMALTPQTVRGIERASYFGAYKGVTDLLTKYLWPEWALVLTRISARFGITPNQITAIGAAACVAATFAFAWGHYWLGMALGLVFMVLDTVDGKLARCTITSSKWGNIADHGMDLVHPPFWWVQGVIQIGYWVQRLIEGVFMRQNGMMHIHVWRRFDSRFRLITARRNPNMVLLFVATLFARPDLGLIAVAWWTVISCTVHAVRAVQAWRFRARGGTITSWLSEA